MMQLVRRTTVTNRWVRRRVCAGARTPAGALRPSSSSSSSSSSARAGGSRSALLALAAATACGGAWAAWGGGLRPGGAAQRPKDEEAAAVAAAAEEEEERSCRRLGLPTPAEASALPVVHLPGFLTAAEVEQLRLEVRHAQVEQQVGMMERGPNEAPTMLGVWRTSYLHTGGTFGRRLPALREKLRAAMVAADAQGGWGLLTTSGGEKGKEGKEGEEGEEEGEAGYTAEELAGTAARKKSGGSGKQVRFRTVECHEYGAGGRLSAARHYDAGSLVTIDVMLARPGEDFDGGTFYTPRLPGPALASAVAPGSVGPAAAESAGASGEAAAVDREAAVDRYPQFGYGDAVVFPSHKYHNVEPVTRGRRVVLVAELWEGPEKECAHRCLSADDKCEFSLKRSHYGKYAEQLAMLG